MLFYGDLGVIIVIFVLKPASLVERLQLLEFHDRLDQLHNGNKLWIFQDHFLPFSAMKRGVRTRLFSAQV